MYFLYLFPVVSLRINLTQSAVLKIYIFVFRISQLHNVSHSRDKTLREEREQRQRQMALLQRDVATLPPEAVAELIGADYTLSRQSQSPSSVLLNWLWGRTTPRQPDNS